MVNTKKIAVIIAAAGSGKRMGSGINKQYLYIGDMPVIARTIKAFNENPMVDEILVVLRESETEYFKQEILNKYHFAKVKKVVIGGAQRQDSVFNAVKQLDSNVDYVLIHDGARPLIKQENINTLIEAVDLYGAAAIGVPVKDTIKIAEDSWLCSTPDRKTLFSVQTPQGFRKDLIRRAFEKAEEENFYGTDEASLLERLNQKVYIVMGDYSNIKITTIEDLAVAEALLKMNPDRSQGGSTMRVGTGYDVHAFAENRKLILGGVEIPFEKGLMGHSDADVLLHAIMDALLGACALADIGKYFPDTDENYRGISSLILLEKVGDLIGSEGYEICNIDATVIAERPKIAPYIHQMIKHIAEVLKIQEDKVNIKGTTTEGLGFIGREEGIAAQAIVAVEQ